MRAGKSAASTVMPLVSAALYLSQFVSPFLMSGELEEQKASRS